MTDFFFVVSVGLSLSARRLYIPWNPVHVHRSIGKDNSQLIFRPQQEQVPAPADIKMQVRTTVKKHCVLHWGSILGNPCLRNHNFQAMHFSIILKTIGNRKGDCAWSCSRWQTQPEKICKSQVTHKSVSFTPHIILICALRFADFLRLCLSPRTTSRTISFSISNSF